MHLNKYYFFILYFFSKINFFQLYQKKGENSPLKFANIMTSFYMLNISRI